MNKEPFVITVGRQFGSGGRELGRALAEDWRLNTMIKNFWWSPQNLRVLTRNISRKRMSVSLRFCRDCSLSLWA